MRHLFLLPEQFSDTAAHITGQDHLHLSRVLRMRIGETITLLDNTGRAWRAEIAEIGKSETVANLVETVVLPPEPEVSITVYQALGKNDKFEQVVQHGTEVGASRFIPLRTERCNTDIPAAKVSDRIARWQSIAKGAAEQSGRARIPEVLPPVTFADLTRSFVERASTESCLLLHTSPQTVPLREALKSRPTAPDIALFIGPEGGWSSAEADRAQLANFLTVSLGSHILRTETAALVAISQIRFYFS